MSAEGRYCAYTLGYHAYFNGNKIDQNPYLSGSDYWLSWDDGYSDAISEQLQNMNNQLPKTTE